MLALPAGIVAPLAGWSPALEVFLTIWRFEENLMGCAPTATSQLDVFEHNDLLSRRAPSLVTCGYAPWLLRPGACGRGCVRGVCGAWVSPAPSVPLGGLGRLLPSQGDRLLWDVWAAAGGHDDAGVLYVRLSCRLLGL